MSTMPGNTAKRSAADASATSEDGRRAVVAVDLTGAPSFYPRFEYAIGRRVSLLAQLEFGWTSWDGSAFNAPDTHSLSLGGEVGVNGFLTGRAPSGLWLGLRFGATWRGWDAGGGVRRMAASGEVFVPDSLWLAPYAFSDAVTYI